jgi:hypothetical protein
MRSLRYSGGNMKKMRSTGPILCVLAMLAVTGSAASASTFSIQTTPAAAAAMFPGQQVATFDGATPGAFSTYSEAGVTFTTDVGAEFIDGAYLGAYNTFGANSLHNCYCSTTFGSVTMTFTAPVTGVGFFWGASDDQWTLAAYDTANALIESFDLPITKFSDAGDFVGIKAPGIAYAVLSGPSDDFVFIDNVEGAFTGAIAGAVPEPKAWAMMLVGFGLVGSAMRKRLGRTAAYG